MWEYIKHVFRVWEHRYRERTKGVSPHWKDCARDFLLEHPTCAACGGKSDLAVHHIKPYFTERSLEVDWSNLISLCFGPLECHVRLGHGGGYRFYNPNIRIDAEAVLKQPALRPILEQRAFDNHLYRDVFT